ncbi:MAG: Rv2175c family DNA-binding protein [Actinomycetota bacterium]
MSDPSAGTSSATSSTLSLPQVAEALAVPITRIHQYLRDGALVAIRDPENKRAVPSAYLRDGLIVKGLSGVIRLLRDARYSDEEIVDWLARVDPSLPGTPIDALRQNRGTEVKRRAQSAGF